MKWFRSTPLGEARWAVVDCETSGLDPARDRLLSVAAVRVKGERLLPGGFDALLRQREPSARENIEVHGIGGDAQLAGRDPDVALPELLAFIGVATPVAFHAPFDAEVLRRAAGASGLKMRKNWLDLAQLAPVLFPALGRTCKALDDWLAAFSIAHPRRHDALADAFATAQLFLVLLAVARAQGARTARDLSALARASRWIG